MLGDKLDNYWPLADIQEKLKEDYQIDVPLASLREWAHRASTGFPKPIMVGRYTMYDIIEVREWYVLWTRATARLGNGDRLNGQR